jgi:predicted nucleotidyltransferase
MARAIEQLKGMIEKVARALGDEMLGEVAFVGGCTTGLLVTDDVTKEAIRFTDDVDLIINVVGHTGWAEFQEKLKSKGFSIHIEDEVICRMRLGELKVDFMPDDKDILGFSNQWYKQSLEQAQDYQLSDDFVIRLLTPPYFMATKLDAYKGRGNDDPLASHDMEDILNIVDGRQELIDEIKSADQDVRVFIASEIEELLAHDSIEYAVQGVVMGDTGRIDIIFERLEAIKALKGSA